MTSNNSQGPHVPLTGVDLNHFFREREPILNAELHRKFIPPTVETRPLDLFTFKQNRCTLPGMRFIRRGVKTVVLLFIDGAATDNGRDNARAGFGVYFRPDGNVSQRLERPPPGVKPTSNRAELRAAICALALRHWPGEGFERIVLASDSEYVVLGCCERLPVWERNGWKTSAGTPVKNRDLWEKLSKALKRWEAKGISVQFWRIPREWNTIADMLAKQGAQVAQEPLEFTEIAAFDTSPVTLVQHPPLSE